jgi:hypothetical protein
MLNAVGIFLNHCGNIPEYLDGAQSFKFPQAFAQAGIFSDALAKRVTGVRDPLFSNTVISRLL